MMNKLAFKVLLASILLVLSSCATILNSKKTSLRIITSKPSILIVDSNKVEAFVDYHIVSVPRAKAPLEITANADSTSKTVLISSKMSTAFWLNLGFNYFLGMLVDLTNQKRFAFPKTVYIDLNDTTSNAYLKYVPYKSKYDLHSDNLKITPFKLIGTVNPSLEVSYEKRTAPNFTTQFLGAVQISNSIIDPNFRYNINGFRLSVEERYYFKKSAPKGFYVSLEANYLHKKFNDVWSFYDPNLPDSIYPTITYLDTFGINRKTISFNLKLGVQTVYKRMIFDFYAGLGPKYRHVTHFDRINPKDKMELPRHPGIHYVTEVEGKFWTISIPLNIKIGWAL